MSKIKALILNEFTLWSRTDNVAVVCGLFGIAPEHMIKGLHEGTVPIDEVQQAADVDLLETIEKRMVNGLAAWRIAKGPAHLWTTFEGLEVLIIAWGNARIDLDQAMFELRFEFG